MINSQLFSNFLRRRRFLKYARPADRQVRHKLGQLFLLLIGLILINSLSMVHFEALGWGDALWLSITTATTVGYGDFSASSWQGRLVTVVCMYMFAIGLLAQFAAEFFEYRLQIREDKKTGNWIWGDMKNHLLIINTPDDNTDVYLQGLISEIRATPELAELPIQLLTHKYPQGLPHEVSQYGVVHRHGVAEDNANLLAVNVSEAAYIAILARTAGDAVSDSLTFDVLSRLDDLGSSAMIAAECAVDSNRQRLKEAGAAVVIRPIRAYPELLVRSLVAPGTEAVLENLFTHSQSHMVRVDLDFDGLVWKQLVLAMLNADLGQPVAYVDDGGVHTTPAPDKVCTGKAVIVLIGEDQRVSASQVAGCLEQLP